MTWSKTYLHRDIDGKVAVILLKEERELILMYRWLHQESKDKEEVLVNLARRKTKNNQKEKSGKWQICQKTTLTGR